MKNKYYSHSRISEAKFREILKYFSLDFTAEMTSELTGISRNTINKIYQKLREKLYEECQKNTPQNGDVEIDESYFGPTRVRGKRGRGAGGKTIVFGLLKRGGKVFTEIVPDAKAKSLIPIIRGQIENTATIHSDGWRAYDGLVDYGYEKHYRVHHGKNEFARGKKHINGIESFWSYAKRRLRKFNGIQKHKFILHLKETEFRFNYRHENIYAIILKILRKNPL
jgi:transposase